MKRIPFFSFCFVLLFTGCYCEHYVTYSSVRHLEGTRSWDICHLPPPMERGKSVILTPYYGDALHTKHLFRMSDTNHITSDIDFNSKGIFGLQIRRYIILGKFPGPLVGIGMNYSRNNFTATYFTSAHSVHQEQNLFATQNRYFFTLDAVTLIRPQMMGSFNFAVGKVWTKRKIDYEFAQYDYADKKSFSQFDWRIAYGLQFYLRPTMALQMELGYGGGSFFRGGLSWWI